LHEQRLQRTLITTLDPEALKKEDMTTERRIPKRSLHLSGV
jgi:hypothetical protein